MGSQGLSVEEMINLLLTVPQSLRNKELVFFDSGHTLHIRTDVSQLNVRGDLIQVMATEYPAQKNQRGDGNRDAAG